MSVLLKTTILKRKDKYKSKHPNDRERKQWPEHRKRYVQDITGIELDKQPELKQLLVDIDNIMKPAAAIPAKPAAAEAEPAPAVAKPAKTIGFGSVTKVIPKFGAPEVNDPDFDNLLQLFEEVKLPPIAQGSPQDIEIKQYSAILEEFIKTLDADKQPVEAGPAT